ncbi:hypothetical protein RvY_00656-2 [Ramazzottius varieornatus]|uniref:guanylate cyclase n=1 Tax=Ramazzottius varieornatus TaxID=947166 RepID=A0A1D1UNC5_RAMVA|nr:hypothetical protein RvY_00656-2 [Ramazzottius varieornatus]
MSAMQKPEKFEIFGCFSAIFFSILSAEVNDVEHRKKPPPIMNLTLFAVFPTNGDLFYRQQLTRPTLDYALEELRNTTLSGYHIRLDFEYIGTSDLNDCGRVNNVVVYKTIEQVTVLSLTAAFTGTPAIVPAAYFGPGCLKGVEDMATWLVTQQQPLFDAVASSDTLRDKTQFPTIIRTGFTDRRLKDFHRKMLRHFQWNNTQVQYLAARDDPVWRGIASLHPRPIRICGTNTSDLGYYQETLSAVLLRYTGVVFFAPMDCVKTILIEAVKMNLTSPAGQLTFIVTNFFDTRYWGTMRLNASQYNSAVGTTVEERMYLQEAYKQTFLMTYYMPETAEQHMRDLNDKVLEYVRNNKHEFSDEFFYEQTLVEEGINPSVMGYYASVHVFGQAVKEYFDRYGRPADADQVPPFWKQRILEIIRRKKTFRIPNLGTIVLNDEGDTEGSFALRAYNSSTDTFETWMYYLEGDTDLKFAMDEDYYQPACSPLTTPAPIFTTTHKTTVWTNTPAFVFGLITCSIVGAIVASVAISYYVKKAQLGSKWWIINPDELKPIPDQKAMLEGKRMSLPKSFDGLSTASGITWYQEDQKSEHRYCKDVALVHYNSQVVATRKLTYSWKLSCNMLSELRDVRLHNHVNLLKILGYVVENNDCKVVNEHAPRGTLADLLTLGELEWSFRYSLLSDLIEGLMYIHKFFHSHRRLSSLNCMIDRTFVLKIRDYAPKCLQPALDNMCPWEKLWTAPELLRGAVEPDYQRADVYSIGIIIQEITASSPPYPSDDRQTVKYDPEDIIWRVKRGGPVPFRPILPDGVNTCDGLRGVMEKCWSELPEDRPLLPYLKNKLRGWRGTVKRNLFDNLMDRIQAYAGQLEHEVEVRTQQLREEQHKMQSLLYELLPKSVADRLIAKNPVDPEPYDCVTVYFSDIVSFTTISAESSPQQVVQMLNELYKLFDGIIENFDAYKVETIGDAYMVVSGLPNRNGNAHARVISLLALNILQASGHFRIPHRPNEHFKIRIGLHSGPCVAGNWFCSACHKCY